MSFRSVMRALATRVDAANPRERVMMFASAAVALVAIVDTAVLSPAMTERRQIAQQAVGRARDIATLRTQLTSLDAGPESPDARLRRQTDAARAELAALDQRIQSQLAARDDIAHLPAVLDRLLARHERLTLVRLSTAAPAAAAPFDTSGRTDGGAARSTSNATASAASTVIWQGVDISVAGRYADLVRWLAELESLMPGLRWGELRVVAVPATSTAARDAQLPVLSLRLTLPGDAP
jgi:MSHA biogenesis protein MshJ